MTIVKNKVITRGIRALRNSMIYPQYFPKDYFDLLLNQLHTIDFKRKELMKKGISPFMRIEISVFFMSSALYKRFIIVYSKTIHLFL